MKRILIADDRLSSRELVRAVLERLGYAVEEAGDGVETLERMRASAPDLLLLDLHMPRVDGYGVWVEMQRDPALARIPVVVMTASAMESERNRATDAGLSRVLTKPVSLAMLRAILNEHFGGNSRNGC